MAAEKPHVDRGQSLINPAVGTDFGVGRVKVHDVLSGASVPLGQNSCEVRIGLLDTVQHDYARHILEGRFEIKSNKDSGGVSFREVLNGFDHRVCSVWSSNTVLQTSRTFGHYSFLPAITDWRERTS